MSHNVQYVFCDALTGAVVAEIPLQGVSIRDHLDGGDFRGTLHLDQSGLSNDVLVAATEPGRSMVVVERGGVPIWGGMIWTATYQSQAKSLQLYGKDLKAYSESRFIRQSIGYTGIDQITIFLNLYALMQSDPNSIQVELPAPFVSGIPRTVETTESEFRTYRSVLDSVADADDGFDWIINWSRTGGVYRKRLQIGYPTIGSPIHDGSVTFEYYDSDGVTGAGVTNYWRNDTMSGAATHLYGLGGGEGESMLRAEQIHSDLLAGNFPRFDAAVSFKDILVQSTLDALTYREALLRRSPMGVLTLECVGERAEPTFGSYAKGDMVNVSITDPRHPSGMRAARRLLGWEYYPGDDDTVEYARLSLEGEDAT